MCLQHLLKGLPLTPPSAYQHLQLAPRVSPRISSVPGGPSLHFHGGFSGCSARIAWFTLQAWDASGGRGAVTAAGARPCSRPPPRGGRSEGAAEPPCRAAQVGVASTPQRENAGHLSDAAARFLLRQPASLLKRHQIVPAAPLQAYPTGWQRHRRPLWLGEDQECELAPNGKTCPLRERRSLPPEILTWEQDGPRAAEGGGPVAELPGFSSGGIKSNS